MRPGNLNISARPTPAICVAGLTKNFTLHTQAGITIPVFKGLNLSVKAGECVCLNGPSGSGKSTFLRSLYGNIKPQSGRIIVDCYGTPIDIVSANPWNVEQIRRHVISYVSQFLRVIPRVSTLDVVADPARAAGSGDEDARMAARTLLTKLRIPERLWSLAPATFSGGEQQRVNIARGLAAALPILLLDEPTASLDTENKRTVIELILEARTRGTAIVGVFHDREVREALSDRLFEFGIED